MTLSAIVLAAGKATRMKSQRVKVLHEICGRPMLAYVLDAARAAGVERLVVVVGHDRMHVMEAFRDDPGITWVAQDQQNGTGHAVLVTRPAFFHNNGSASAAAQTPASHPADESSPTDSADSTFILAGDGPLIRPETLRQLAQRHAETGAAVTLATAVLDDPTGYGRIVRNAAGELLGIVEQSVATEEQQKIREVNPSYYLFQTQDLFSALDQVQPNNPKGEYYLTDTLAILRQAGKKLAAVAAVPREDVLSINTRRELAVVNRVMQQRIQEQIMAGGVTLISPENTWIEYGATIGEESVIEPFTFIGGTAQISPGTRVAAGSVIGRKR